MAKYKVYFEIYGKKMKTTVDAKTAEHAKELIRSKIQFNHIAEDHDVNIDDVFQNLLNVLKYGK